MKCPRCGFWDPYWLKMAYDREAEYIKPTDCQDLELVRLKRGEIMEKNGMVYGRTKTYIIRIATEIFRARGMDFRAKGLGYWDSLNFNRKTHKRTSNERLDSYVTTSREVPFGPPALSSRCQT